MNKKVIRKGAVTLIVTILIIINFAGLTSFIVSGFDGISWEKWADENGAIPVLDVGAPGDLDSLRVLSPAIIRDDDVLIDNNTINDDELYKMWYIGNNIPDWRYFRIFYATSPDGINWNKYTAGTGSAVPVIEYGGSPDGMDDHSVYAQAVTKENGLYRMWYSGLDAGEYHHRVLYATSWDGINWIKHGLVLGVGNPGEPDERDAYAPTIVIDEDAPSSERYKMWYLGQTHPGPLKIFYATSPDGIVWTKYADANGAIPVLEPGGAPGGVDDSSVSHPDVMIDEGMYKMWYVGVSSQGFKLLYATSMDGINWNKYGEALGLGLPGEMDSVTVGTPTVMRETNGSYRMWYMGYDGLVARICYAYPAQPDNLPPIAEAGEDQSLYEGEEVHFDGSTSQDPDGTIVSYEWDFDIRDGLWWDTAAPPDATGVQATHIYGDNGNFTVTLRVTDDQNLSATDTCNITVLNVDPNATIESAVMDVEIGLRVAGRKYNDVGMTLFEEGNPITYLSIERMPGSPNDQMAWIPMTLDMTRTHSASVTFTPEDPPNIGANPVWIYLKFENGSVEELHHTFNVQQSMERDSEHWNHVEPWYVNITGNLTGLQFELASQITDPGSDDETLIFTYGNQTVTSVYLNNPPNPDPYPSPDVNPRDIADVTSIIYEGPGIIFLTVVDDDGGTDPQTITIQ
ncbi:MAG: PKD domain-containing protein [Thermoplasmata archaeon]|nr:MAG: PKD domain-containing protein [Thermoplasmata archaeon]